MARRLVHNKPPSMKIIAIHQPQYLPYLGFFQKIKHCDLFIHLDQVAYQPRGYHNRNKIKTSAGEQWLSVPVVGSQNDKIMEIQTDPTAKKWSEKHWKSIMSSYGKAPYFKIYAPELESVYRTLAGLTLAEINIRLNSWIASKIGISTAALCASALKPEGQSSALLIDLCKKVNATHYLSGPGGRNYMDLNLFKNNGIEVIWQEYKFREYDQVFPALGFMPYLSAIDALMCVGPRAADLI